MSGRRAPLTLGEVAREAARRPGLTAAELAARLGAEPVWVELALAELERLRLRAAADGRPAAARPAAPQPELLAGCRGCPLEPACSRYGAACETGRSGGGASARAPRPALLARPPGPGAAPGAGGARSGGSALAGPPAPG